ADCGFPSCSPSCRSGPTTCACCAACTPTCRPTLRPSCRCTPASSNLNDHQWAHGPSTAWGPTTRICPGFVTINPPRQNGGPASYSSAFLPAVYQGTPISLGFGGPGGGPGAQGGGSPRVSNIRNPNQTNEAQRQQLDFIQRLNHSALEREPRNAEIE